MDAVNNAVNSTTNAVSNAANSVAQTASDAVNTATNAAGNVVNNVVDAGNNVIASATPANLAQTTTTTYTTTAPVDTVTVQSAPVPEGAVVSEKWTTVVDPTDTKQFQAQSDAIPKTTGWTLPMPNSKGKFDPNDPRLDMRDVTQIPDAVRKTTVAVGPTYEPHVQEGWFDLFRQISRYFTKNSKDVKVGYQRDWGVFWKFFWALVLFGYMIAVIIFNPNAACAFVVILFIGYVLLYLVDWPWVTNTPFWGALRRGWQQLATGFTGIPLWIRRAVGYGAIVLSMLLLAMLQPDSPTGTRAERGISMLGLFCFLGILIILSRDVRHINWDTVGVGMSLQWLFAILVLRIPFGYAAFNWLSGIINNFLSYAKVGLEFVVGADWAALPIFIFTALPVIIYFAAFISMLYYWGIMDAIINVIAMVMQRLMATSGAESTVAAANIFVGQTEAPLLTRKFLPTMTMAEIHSIMTCGFATIAGGVFAAFVSMGINAQALLTASVMNAPTALAASKVVYPESEIPVTSIEYQNFQKEEERRKAQALKREALAQDAQNALETGAVNPTAGQDPDAWDDSQDVKWLEQVRAERGVEIDAGDQAYNFLHAAANGASSGWAMCGAIVAMLIAFISLFALLNDIVNYFGSLITLYGLTFETIFSYIFWPFAWLMGIPSAECLYAARLLATKMFLNEFVAYGQLASDIANQGKPGVPTVSPRTQLILTYALCSFANIGSIGIQIGGLGAIAPARQNDVAYLAVSTMFTGTIVTFMSACVAGMLL